MEYGRALPKGFLFPPGAFWLRNDLGDRNPFDSVKICRRDRVMDCGSFIGTFAAAAMEAGAASVRCYEPMPKNFAVLEQNMKRYGDQASVVMAALIDSEATAIEMSVSGFSGAHSVLPRPKAKKVFVRARHFRTELLEFSPHVIKFDVEGAEYKLFESLRPGDFRGVFCVFIEFHPYDNREMEVERIRKFLVDEGLTVVKDKLRSFTAIREKK